MSMNPLANKAYLALSNDINEAEAKEVDKKLKSAGIKRKTLKSAGIKRNPNTMRTKKGIKRINKLSS